MAYCKPFFCLPVFCLVLVLFCMPIVAQQQLGSIAGTLTDATGAVIPRSNVDLLNNDTGFKKTVVTREDGTFFFTDLPIGTYTLTFNQPGFKKEVHDRIVVEANRTATVVVKLQPGGSDATVEVNGTPLLNSVDTTNGYVLNSQQVEETPLGTGSFTQLAVLSPGINADFLGTTGTNAGLGNQAIWANGQRDTSNTFTINSVNVSNIFNGGSSSQVGGNRNVLNTGENFLNNGATIQTNTSVYDAIGQGLPTPPPETIQELRVNTSMYDATQGTTSGAHINVQTKSGTNAMHGQIYGYRDFGGLDANSFFNNNAENGTITNPVTGAVAPIPQPPLHRGIAGATLGGPVFKDKLFYFASYQYTTDHDTLGGEFKNFAVPSELTNDRSATGLETLATILNGGAPVTLNPVALTLLQFKLPNGNFLIPSANPGVSTNGNDGIIFPPASTFIAHQANGNLDYILNSKDQIYLKTFFQVDPTATPFAEFDDVLGFPQQLLSKAYTASLQNVISLSPSMSWDQKVGFVREKVFSTVGQPLTPSAAGINVFGSQQFPGISIHSAGDPNDAGINSTEFQFGPNSNFANTGVAQNQLEFTSDLTWVKGRHTLQFGGNFDHTQLNVVNLANQVGFVGFNNFLDFMEGDVASSGRVASKLFTGGTSRYYRADQVGMYVQDKYRLTNTLNLTAGLRYDWDGPLSELNGNLINFNPTQYQFNAATDTIVNDGLVVAGNNPQFATPGTSNSTMTGRQWGLGPRLGLAWSPSFVKNVVIRAGWGMYYDRGEFFTEFSPTAGGGNNGPFGATLQPPSVVFTPAPAGATFANPFGTTAPPGGESPQAFAATLPNLAGLFNGGTPFEFGGYDPSNKLPYSENWNLDVQWQPVNDWVVTAAYIGNHGVHEVEPIPFNQPLIATPQNPVNGQTSSYGYNVVPSETAFTFDGGNTDLRVPFVGFSPNSVLYVANGISNYDAGQLRITKRFSHGFMINTSYTYSHSLDEGSALGLFFNGNNALNLGQNYANSDFDRTHVLTINYIYEMPKIASFRGAMDKVLNGWGIAGITTFQSGQPYSVIDFSGSEGSIFYGSNDFITNPIVPLAPGFTPQTAGNGQGGLNPNAFFPQFLAPGQDGVPAGDTLESAFSNNGRNLFRGPFQKRADLSIFKDTGITERVRLRYAFNVFNLTNTPSFDTPNNNVSFNNGFNDPPTFFANGAQAAQGTQFGAIQNLLGSPRLVQMSLHVIF